MPCALAIIHPEYNIKEMSMTEGNQFAGIYSFVFNTTLQDIAKEGVKL